MNISSKSDEDIILEAEENIVKPQQSNEKKCPNLTLNVIFQICDILVALSLIFWCYGLAPKTLNPFKNKDENTFTLFISRSIITIYFAIFSLLIFISSFYYFFQTKSIYFNFYGRGIFYIFLGNLLILIDRIPEINIKINDSLKYGYYTSYYIAIIGIFYVISSIITNKKCHQYTKCCFLPSPFLQLKYGKQLHFNLNYNQETDADDNDDDDAVDALIAIKHEMNKIELQQTSKKDNIWIKNDKTKNQNKNTFKSKNNYNYNKKKKFNDKPLQKQSTLTKPRIVTRRHSADMHPQPQSRAKPQPRQSFNDRLSIFKNNAVDVSNNKIDKIKNERKEKEKDMKQSNDAKRRATIAITSYATMAAAHSQDINLINKNLKNITKKNCLNKMSEMGLLYGIYVPVNEYQRWDIRSKLDKIIHQNHSEQKHDVNSLNDDKKTNKKEYIKMNVFNLRNNVLLTKISDDQRNDFYQLIQYAIGEVDNIYSMDFTRANVNKSFLDVIFGALQNRLKHGNKFGPEEILLESNPISNNGCSEIINYLLKSPSDLRVLRLSNSFNDIGSGTVVSFCDAMEKNELIIKFSLDISYLMYNNRMDGYIKRNNNLWRNNKKSNPVNMIRRKSYDFLLKKGRHNKGRRSSVPHGKKLHLAHPSLAAIRGGFSLDKAQKKHKKRRSSLPDVSQLSLVITGS